MLNKARRIFLADFVNPIEGNDVLGEALQTIKIYGIWVTNLAIIGMLIYGMILLVLGKKSHSQGMNDSGQVWIFRAIGLGVVEVVALMLLGMFGI